MIKYLLPVWMNGIPPQINFSFMVFTFIIFCFWKVVGLIAVDEHGIGNDNKEEKRIEHLINVCFLLAFINPYPFLMVIFSLLFFGIIYKTYHSIKETWLDKEELF